MVVKRKSFSSVLFCVKSHFSTNQWTADILVASAIAFFGGVFAFMVVNSAETLFFYQNHMPESIYAACGFGYRHPGELSGPIVDFVLQKTVSFNCADLEGIESLRPPTVWATVHLYLGNVIAFFWEGPELTYAELWPLVAITYAFYALGTYVFLRLFFPLILALPGAAVLTLSPIALSMLISFRDFSKAPFVIWTIVLVILAARTNLNKAGLGWAVLAGVVLGVGLGFRTDLRIVAAVAVIALLCVWGLSAFLQRLLRTGVFVATMVVVAHPVFDTPDTGGNGTIISQGLSEPFRRFLGMDSGSYSLGHAYLDELAKSSVAAVERPKTPDWDINESDGYHDVSQVMKVSLPHILNWLPYFVADFATQGMKSASWTIALPALVSTQREAWDPGGPVRFRPDPSQWLGTIYDTIGQPFLVFISMAGLVLFAWREAALRPGSMLTVMIIFAGFLAMTVAQFSVRHVFHLEFFWIIACISFVAVWKSRLKMLRVTPWFSYGACALVLAVSLIYVCLIAYQSSVLPRAFASLLALPRETVAKLIRTNSETGSTIGRFSIAVPANRQNIVSAKPDSMTDMLPVRSIAWDVRAEADRLFLTLDKCPAGKYTIEAQYETRAGVWQKLDYALDVNHDGTGMTEVLLPAFYRPTQNLAQIDVSPLSAECEPVLQRVKGETPLPPHLIAWFSSDWRESWQRRGFGNFGKAPE